MITVKHNTERHEFETLDQAMAWAKELGEFVSIQFNGTKVVSKFEADGNLQNGEPYAWQNRRRN